MADAYVETPPIPEEHHVNERTDSPETRTEDLFSESGDSISEERQLGLDIVYPCGWSGSPHVDYDVVTVHGIRDDYKTAWKEEDGTWWLKDRLFENVSIREVDYSFEVDVDADIFEVDGIAMHAERLLTAYAKDRASLEKTEIDRPIIWICHDLGGTIAKEALCQAITNSKKYGKIAILTTTIIFLGTPHRVLYPWDLEKQIHRLLSLPGPDITFEFLQKVRKLVSQVNRVNGDFLATKLLDRALILNVFVQNRDEISRKRRLEGNDNIPEGYEHDDVPDPITPFLQNTHCIGHSFEAYGRIRLDVTDHADLIHGEYWNELWIKELSLIFDAEGCTTRINHQLLQFQAHILSLAPPTRSLETNCDPLLTLPPILSWIYQQEPYLAFSRAGMRPRLMHLYLDGPYFFDIQEISRALYLHHDLHHGSEDIKKSILYFEFDQWDSRYDNISSMLIYFINAIIWHFWDNISQKLMLQELDFLKDTRAWSLEDLYHLYTTLRFQATHQLIFFIGAFDQCPEEQRRWFLKRVLEEQSYSEAEYRLILSSSTRDDLKVEDLPDVLRINVHDCPAFDIASEAISEELEAQVTNIIQKRPIYQDFQQQLEMVLRECKNTAFLGTILNWLKHYPRGRPTSEIATRINKLLPLTTQNIVHVIVSCLTSEVREKVETVFNWIKYALEPWSAESLAEALTVFYFPDQEPCFIDLDADDFIQEMVDHFRGIITVKDNSVIFSHPSFYLVPALGVEGSEEERAAKVNSTMAEACLRYLQLEIVQEAIAGSNRKTLEGSEWKTPLDAVVISHFRASMAGYAVRFWPRHYKASGPHKPKQLVSELFANKKARGCWETFMWLLSSPLTRPVRGYMSTLPTLARLGLEDLIDEYIKSETGQSSFSKDCWFAITEAAQMGHSDTVRKLLQHVSVDEEELQTALFAGVGQCDANTMSLLIEMIPNLKGFQWPKHLFHRASAVGAGSLLTSMLQSGYDINELGSFYESSPATIAAWRNSVSSLEILLNPEYKADLSIKGTSDDTLLTWAVRGGNPQIVKMGLRAGGNIADKNGAGQTLTQIAVYNYRHKAADILVKAGADLNSGEKENVHKIGLNPPLIIAAKLGALECARTLLTHGADPLVSCASGTALYEAVANNNIEITRLLLEQEQKPDLDAHPPGKEMLLLRAVNTGNADLVSTLIEHGVKFEFADPNGGAFSTPLSRACRKGDLDMVKLLLEKNVDINYTGGVSESPLFASIRHSKYELATYLLQDERIDVHWARNDGVNALIAAYENPTMVRELLKRGVSIEHYSSWGTVLHMAASHWPKTVTALLEHDPKPDLERVCGDDMEFASDIGCTPLQIACHYQSPECIELLLKAGANAKFRNKNGMDAVDILLQANYYYSRDIVQCLELVLSESDYIVGGYVNTKGHTRLHMIKNKTPVDVVRLLVKGKALLDRPDNDGYTPLAISIREDNVSVAKYLIKQGASVNVFSSSFGSILHLAVSKGAVGLAKLLIDSGADREAVDPRHGASLLYTALGINKTSDLQKMVRYLVDEAKVPINKPGGEFGYPVIRAADMTRTDYTNGIKMLKFLIRRKAQLDVIDSQRRRAVHLACTSHHADGIKLLVEAGAEVDVKDMFGRMPFHFAASSPSNSCVEYLLETQKHMDINVADQDGWTPLLWAARSGHASTITRLIAEKANVWTRGYVYNVRDEWSALKLMNFSDRNTALREQLKPKELIRINDEGEEEKWNDDLHEVKAGDKKNVSCKSCLVDIIGLAMRCMDCADDFSLCFKCSSYRLNIHDWEHTFLEIEPLYDQGPKEVRDVDETSDLEETDLDDSDAEGYLNYI